MSKENIILTYQGFTPSEYTKEYIYSIMQEINQESPESTHLKVSFIKKNKEVKGMIHVYSAAGSFFSTAIGSHSKLVAEKMLNQVRRKISKWKTKNHEKVSLKNLEPNPYL